MGPFITMVFLFFIVGFLTTANTQFQGPLKETFLSEVGGLKNTFATLITFSWFLAYPVCGGVGSSWISKYGYKGTLMRGLLVMIVGLGLFFASSYFTVHVLDFLTGFFRGRGFGHHSASGYKSLSDGLPCQGYPVHSAFGYRWFRQFCGNYACSLFRDRCRVRRSVYGGHSD